MNKLGPLNHRQQLRRQMNRLGIENRKRSPYELSKSASIDSNASVSTTTASICSSQSSDDEFQKHATKKRLSFSKYASVILVPCITEYKEAGLFDSLWHEKAEMDDFKDSARREVFDFMQRESCLDFKEAIRNLYHAPLHPPTPPSSASASSLVGGSFHSCSVAAAAATASNNYGTAH